MARQIIGLAALIALTGCVAQDKYNALKIEKDQVVEQLGHSQSEAAAAKAAYDALKSEWDKVLSAGGDKEKALALLRDENGVLKGQLADMDAKYRKALESTNPVFNVINPGLSEELRKLAERYPDILEFDAQRGIIRFKADVTFAPGKADLTAQAKEAIAKVATILNSPDARNYEFLVAGHTDNTPVSNPETKRLGHHDNWYLSAHRAISVGGELTHDGVSPHRLGVAGYADQRPVASNGTTEGKAPTGASRSPSCR